MTRPAPIFEGRARRMVMGGALAGTGLFEDHDVTAAHDASIGVGRLAGLGGEIEVHANCIAQCSQGVS